MADTPRKRKPPSKAKSRGKTAARARTGAPRTKEAAEVAQIPRAAEEAHGAEPADPIEEPEPVDAGEILPELGEPAVPVARISDLRRRLYRIPVLGAVVYLISPPRTAKPSVVRRSVSGSCAVAALLGIGMLFYPVAGSHYPGVIRVPVEKGIEWSNVWSDLQSNRIQNRLKTEFGNQTLASGAPTSGGPLTRLEIPKIGVDTIVVDGTSPSALRAGAGHYPNTPLPGHAGNVGIAGHRTTYGRPFNRIDELRTGDEVILTTPVGRFTYQLSRDPFTTSPDDWTVIDQTSEALLTLTSCHPKGSANQRIIVRAKLGRSEAPASTRPAA